MFEKWLNFGSPEKWPMDVFIHIIELDAFPFSRWHKATLDALKYIHLTDCVKTKNWFRKLRLLCIGYHGKTNHMLKTSNFMKTKRVSTQSAKRKTCS